MRKFSTGVSYYTKAMAQISFPEDDRCCAWCPLLASEYKPDREYCRMTGEYLVAPKHMVGNSCPLIFDNKEEK